MGIEYFCPSGHRLSASDDQAGRGVRCPVCREMAIVPSQSPETETGAKRSESAQPPPLKASAEVRKSRPVPPPLPKVGPAGEDATRRDPPDPPKAASSGPVPPPLKPPTEADLGTPPDDSQAEDEAARPAGRPTGRWFGRKQPLSADGAYRPDRGRIQTVRWLAAILGLVVAFSAAPALSHLNLETAPGWARLVLLVAALQAVYVVWMLLTPDFSSVWVVMLVFALVAAGYGAATAVAIATPLDEPMPFGMSEVRASAARWCGAVLLANALATFLCGRTSAKWRRLFELEGGGRNKRLSA